MTSLNALTPQERTWATICHASAFWGLFFPFGNILFPLIVWLIRRKQSRYVNDQGILALNFQVSVIIYGVIGLLSGGVLLIVAVVAWALLTAEAAYLSYSGKWPTCRFVSIPFFGNPVILEASTTQQVDAINASNETLSKSDIHTALWCHFSALIGCVLFWPLAFVVPLIIWVSARRQSSFVDHHGRRLLNFQLTMTIGVVIIGGIWVWIFWDAPMTGHGPDWKLVAKLVGLAVLLFGMWVMNIMMAIFAAMEANQGKMCTYPAAIPFFGSVRSNRMS